MKTYKSLAVSALVVVAMFLSACGQKEDDKKTTVRRGVIPGTAADANSAAAQNQLSDQGVAMSISSITKTKDTKYNYLTTNYTIGSAAGNIQTQHQLNQSTQAVVSGPSAGMTVQATGYCADTACAWYYLNIDVYQNNTFIYQVGVLRDFTYGHDLYKVVSASSGGQLSASSMFQALYNAY